MKHITIPADKNKIQLGITPIIGLLEDLEVDFKLLTKIEVALDEVLTNIALYAYKPEIGNVDIDYGIDELSRLLTIIISDEGKEFDPLATKDPDITLSEKDRKIGGLGIFIVKQVMDEVTYERRNNKNILTLKKIV